MSGRDVLLLGGSGQVGQALRRVLGDERIMAPTSRELPLTEADALATFVRAHRPWAVVNAAAFTKVDDAEGQRELAVAINATAPAILAESAAAVGARFIHISTDYVFDGRGELPYTVGAPTNPLNVYGTTKRDGEVRVLATNADALVMRTAWVHSGRGANFVGTAVRVLRGGSTMRVVDDQVGTPTSADTIALAIEHALARPTVTGVLHVTDAGVASWYDVACCVLEVLKAEGCAPEGVDVVPVDSSAFPRPARRPKVSILDGHTSRRLLEFTPPHWRNGVIASVREWLGKSHERPDLTLDP